MDTSTYFERCATNPPFYLSKEEVWKFSKVFQMIDLISLQRDREQAEENLILLHPKLAWIVGGATEGFFQQQVISLGIHLMREIERYINKDISFEECIASLKKLAMQVRCA
jgi:hypothetical protein